MDPGLLLGPYRIERVLGSGGMGTVYLARVEEPTVGLSPGEPVALKVVHPQLLETPGFFKRFLREGEIGRAIRHANVVRTLDCDSLVVAGARRDFLVMEFVEGQTLRALLEEMRTVPEALCRHIGREVARALAAIHGAGALHRDVKPENVLITADHSVKVMDLGLARLTDEALRLSQAGTFLGSVLYAAPECFRREGGEPDHRADLHALGLVLYELCTGRAAYAAPDMHGAIARVLGEAPRRIGESNPQVSPFFEEVVHTLLAKDPAQRFGSAEELLATLEAEESGAWWQARARALRAETRRPIRRVRVPRETALYGREAEVEHLRRRFQEAKDGAGRVVLLEGEAGIGKSRLVDEVVGRLHQEGEDLTFLWGSYPPGGAATAAGAFSSAYREHFGEAGSAEYLAATPALVGAFDALLRGEPAPEAREPLTPDSLQACFVYATRALARERPTIILIDDLHFAPDEGRALFAALATAIEGDRVLLVGTARPGLAEAWRAGVLRRDHATSLALPRLGPKDLMLLLLETLGSEALAARLGSQIALKSDGNPFFAFELVRGLREGQIITQAEDGSWILTGRVDAIQIPSSILDLVNARVSSLAPSERDLLDLAACLGYEFDPTLLADALGAARIPLLKQLAQIERAHRLVRASGRRFVFDHHQVQEALYASLPELLREEYHGLLADALERRAGGAEGGDLGAGDGAACVALCEHSLKGGRGSAALRHLERAVRHLTQGCLPDAAARLDAEALAVPGLLAGRARVDVLLRMAASLDATRREDAHRDAVREAVALADADGDPGVRARAHWALGHCLERAHAFEPARIELDVARDLAVAAGDRATEIRALNCRGVLHAESGRVAEAQAAFEAVLSMHRAAGDERGECGVVGNLGIAHRYQGRLAEARRYGERHLELARRLGDRRGEVAALGNLALIVADEGRAEEARELLEHYVTRAREIAHRRGELMGTRALGVAHRAAGRLGAAIECHARALALARECGSRLDEAMATGELGLDWMEVGRLEAAQEALQRSLRTFEDLGSPGPVGASLEMLARLALERGDPAEAGRLFEEVERRAGRDGPPALATAAHLGLGTLAAERGDVAKARAHLEVVRERGTPEERALARIRLGTLPGGDTADARAALEEFGARMSAQARRLAHWLLWRATGEGAHLGAARRLVEEALRHAPPECRAEMARAGALNRAILDAGGAEAGAASVPKRPAPPAAS